MANPFADDDNTDENPFLSTAADPFESVDGGDSNPFAAPPPKAKADPTPSYNTNDNPFAKPAPAAAAAPTRGPGTAAAASDNPFARPPPPSVGGSAAAAPNTSDNPFSKPKNDGGFMGSSSKRSSASAANPYGSTNGGGSSSTDAEVQRQLAALRAREAELARREKELNNKEVQLQENITHVGRLKNWPKCYPLVYHSIENDIKTEHRRYVRQFYFNFYWTIWSVFMNLLTVLSGLFAKTGPDTTDLMIAVGCVVVGLPIAHWMWYRSIYNGFRTEKTRQFVCFFCFFGFHVLFCAFAAIGLAGSGQAGVITVIDAFQVDKRAVGIMAIISMCDWVFGFFFSLYLIKRVQTYYRGRGMTLQQAQMEATSDFFSSDVGKATMTAGAKAAANGAAGAYGTAQAHQRVQSACGGGGADGLAG